MAYELFFDGFESYGASGNGSLLNKFGYQNYSAPSGEYINNGVVTTGRRTNTKGFYLFYGEYFVLRRPLTPSRKVTLGLAVKQTNAAAAVYLRFCEGNTVHARLTLPAVGNLALEAGGNSAVNSSGSLASSTWYFVEMGIDCDNAGSYEVRVNGDSAGWLAPTSADTQNGGTGLIDNVRINTSHEVSASIDDLWITYGDELVWLGDRRIDLLNLDADDTPQDWTPSSGNAWERLNAGDGYVASNIDEATSLFTLANLPYTPESIDGIAVRSLMDKSDAGARSAAVLLKSGATEVESAELALSTSSLGLTHVFQVDPATNAAWTTNAVNALKPGVRVKT